MFNRIILGQFFEWIITAVIGGAFIGALSFRLIHRRSKDLANGHEIQKLEE